MNRTRIKGSLFFYTQAKPKDIQACFTDFGHDWVVNKNIFQRKFDSYKFEILSPKEQKIGVTLVLFKLFKIQFDQIIRVVPGESIEICAINHSGFNTRTLWEFKELNRDITEIKVSFCLEVPQLLGWAKIPLKALWIYIRKKSWKSDQAMLERRHFLLTLGFGEGGVSPQNSLVNKAAPSAVPMGV